MGLCVISRLRNRLDGHKKARLTGLFFSLRKSFWLSENRHVATYAVSNKELLEFVAQFQGQLVAGIVVKADA